MSDIGSGGITPILPKAPTTLKRKLSDSPFEPQSIIVNHKNISRAASIDVRSMYEPIE